MYIKKNTEKKIEILKLIIETGEYSMKLEQLKTKATPEILLKISKQIESLKSKDDLNKYIEKNKNILDIIVEYAKAVMLFTEGGFAAVKDPESFNPKRDGMTWRQSNLIQMLGEYSSELSGSAGKEDYQKANYIILTLAKRNSLPGEKKEEHALLYRGLGWVPPGVFLNLVMPGKTYSIGNSASCSVDKEIAFNWISRKGRWKVIYILNNKKQHRGMRVGFSSANPQEEEVILAGNIKIKSFIHETDRSKAKLGFKGQKLLKKFSGGVFKTTNFEELVKFVETVESQLGASKSQQNDMGITYVYAEVIE